jgi:hypothetical protein
MPLEVSLSFDEGTPIAAVEGGEWNGQLLRLNDGRAGKKGKKVIQELDFGKAKLGKMPSRKQTEALKIMNDAYVRGIPAEHLPPELVSVFKSLTAKEDKQTRVALPPGSQFVLLPCPDKEKRSVYYIAGASGSGKSYVAKNLAERYKKQFPDRNVYLVSKLGEDSTLDSMKTGKPIRLNIEKLMGEPLKDLEPLRDCLIIFDDYDTFTGKEEKCVQKLIDDIATMGRHTNTTMLCLTHYLSNYKKTRLMLTEATHFVLYPQSTGSHALNYMLKTYLGMSPDEVSQLRKSGSRWICVHKNFPQYCVTETDAWILNTGEED